MARYFAIFLTVFKWQHKKGGNANLSQSRVTKLVAMTTFFDRSSPSF